MCRTDLSKLAQNQLNADGISSNNNDQEIYSSQSISNNIEDSKDLDEESKNFVSSIPSTPQKQEHS
jgi:hypothetical protein